MSTETPKVSVIIPCYNHGRYVDEAVQSVLDQTFQAFEIIIVNDGSSDADTVALLENYRKPKTSVIHTKNQGPASARNRGIEAAKGEYILPLDADDRIGPQYLEKAADILDRFYQVGIVYCEAEFFGDERRGNWELPEYSFPEILVDNVIFNTALFRKSDWAAAGGYNSNIKDGWEDYDFWLSLIERGKEVHRIPETLFYYRLQKGGRTSSMSKEHLTDCYVTLFRNHPDLYANHIEAVFRRLVTLQSENDQLKQFGGVLGKFLFLKRILWRRPGLRRIARIMLSRLS